ncbi:MAG TPA: hypothetical protein VIK29_09635 [Paludibacter sp.]
MKIFKNILFLLILTLLVSPIQGQNKAVLSDRTPEQEAIKQTEKLQHELNLSLDQTKQVYEINLRYARERQVSNTRSEAMERIKNKNAELQTVLNADQNSRLENKRYERTTVEIPNGNGIRPAISTSFRSSEKYRPNSPTQTLSTDLTPSSGSRSINPQSNPQSPQSIKRSMPSNSQNTRINTDSRSTYRSQNSTTNSTKRTENQSNSNRR